MRSIIGLLVAVILMGSLIVSCSTSPVAPTEMDVSSHAPTLDAKMLMIEPLISDQEGGIGTVTLSYANEVLQVAFWIPEDTEWSFGKTEVRINSGDSRTYKHIPESKEDCYRISAPVGTRVHISAYADVVAASGQRDAVGTERVYLLK